MRAVMIVVAALAANPTLAQNPPAAPASPAEAPVSESSSVVVPAPAAAASDAAVPHAMNALLPKDLSPWGMFLSADMVVKVVMVGLFLASVITWTVWLAKSIELTEAKRRSRRTLSALGDARSLSEAAGRLPERGGQAAELVRAAQEEVRLSAGLPADGIKERVGTRLDRIEAAAARAINRGTGVLATIGAVAPFVGLFGTVWGIMNSFIGISRSQTTNLAVVAPGIAEALLATAIGLVAAIPAVIIYNVFARAIGGYRALLADASAEVLRLVSRDLDRRRVPLAKAAE